MYEVSIVHHLLYTLASLMSPDMQAYLLPYVNETKYESRASVHKKDGWLTAQNCGLLDGHFQIF